MCNSILERVATLEKRPLLIAIDGRCASGKTTLAGMLKDILCCNVVHMDHFFLQPHQRTTERLQEPGGNVDYERVLEEVLLPLSKGETAVYRFFDCHKQDFGEEIVLQPADIIIVEGSYACHPVLRSYYDLKIFLTVEPEEQLCRIELRNGADAADVFREKWIPLEEAYFAQLKVAEESDIVMDVSSKMERTNEKQ
ncbi:MAG: uridine kinase [Lachnospiraceae bacterium]|nr:uridine kinase [Lachnospiraceae bacterium]